MSIYPMCNILKIAMICCSLLGIFPWQFLFNNNKSIQKTYSIYSKLIIYYNILFITRCSMALVSLINQKEMQLDLISENLCVTMACIATVVRNIVMKINLKFAKIIEDIIKTEKKISSMKDKKLVVIYEECCYELRRNTMIFLIIQMFSGMQYIGRPLLTEPIEIHKGNETILMKPLPLSTWFPFDENKHYMAAYIWNIFDCMICAPTVAFTDIFMFSLIIYPTGQLKMLQYMCKNFDELKQRCKRELMVSDDTAAYLTFLDIIQKHREIIMFIDEFNAILDKVMVLDFVQSSLQIAFTVTQSIGKKVTWFLVVFVGTWLSTRIVRLTVFYYYANDVILLSEQLSYSIWESNWHEQSEYIKFMTLMFMMRVKKPLKFLIGAFGVMSLTSFISILKATYSYITLVYSSGDN